jgi:hypothetical protein
MRSPLTNIALLLLLAPAAASASPPVAPATTWEKLDLGLEVSATASPPAIGTYELDARPDAVGQLKGRWVEVGAEVRLAFRNRGAKPVLVRLQASDFGPRTGIALVNKGGTRAPPRAIKIDSGKLGYRSLTSEGGIAISGDCLDNDPVVMRDDRGLLEMLVLFCVRPRETDTLSVMFRRPPDLQDMTVRLGCNVCGPDGVTLKPDFSRYETLPDAWTAKVLRMTQPERVEQVIYTPSGRSGFQENKTSEAPPADQRWVMVEAVIAPPPSGGHGRLISWEEIELDVDDAAPPVRPYAVSRDDGKVYPLAKVGPVAIGGNGWSVQPGGAPDSPAKLVIDNGVRATVWLLFAVPAGASRGRLRIYRGPSAELRFAGLPGAEAPRAP